jgi:hypothetical protein
MSHRLTGMTLASAIVIALCNTSTAEAQLLSSGPLSVPITGSVTGGGSSVGPLSIQRFDAPGGGRTGVRANLSLPVTGGLML